MTHSEPAPASRGLLLSVALISAATLAVQVLQTRLFSVMLWHHLTYMVVTVTLLGFGAGGALLALVPQVGRMFGEPRRAVSFCCSMFGLGLIAAFVVLCHTPLDTLDIEQDRSKYLLLFLRYAYLIVPFLFAGLGIAIALQQYPAIVHRTYFWNLIGSGIGSFLFVLLVQPLGGPGCLYLFASLGGLAGLAALAGTATSWTAPVRIAALLAVAIWPLSMVFPAATDRLLPIEPARSKMLGTMELYYEGLVDYYRAMGHDYPELDDGLRTTVWSPTCRIDTFPIPRTPDAVQKDRETPVPGQPRGQVHVFQDGDAPTVIWSGSFAADFDYQRHWYGLGYRALPAGTAPDVLVIGSGGGNDIETALHHDARHVTAVDLNGATMALVRGKFGEYSGRVYDRENVTAVHSEGRSYLRRSGEKFDLIQMSGTDTYAALSSGSYIFSESYLYTVEAFEDFFSALADDGVITVIRFRFDPPRENLKLVATAARALRSQGIEDPRAHFLVINQEDAQIKDLAAQLQGATHLTGIRNKEELTRRLMRDYKEPMRYAAVIMSRSPFTEAQVRQVEAALPAVNGSPLVTHTLYYAAGHRGEDNAYSRFLAAAAAGPDAADAFHETYHQEHGLLTAPATDDKPFFFNFNSWGDLSFFSSSSDGYAALTGSQPIGLYILAALGLQTLIATALLILLPLFRLGFRAGSQNSRLRVLGYFIALGLAYLLVEISTIQRFVLYLGHPVYSLSVGLCSFLVFSGLGSAWAGRIGAGTRTAGRAAFAVVGLLLLQALVLPALLQATLAWSEPMRILLTVLTIAPLAFAMGIPFPTGLGLLSGEAKGVVAWAFGVNGAASVMASILSILVAMEAGFFVVTLLAAALYGAAAFCAPRQSSAIPA
ncbi:MAG: hypothetical protein AB7O97_14770 [Planctomycetota bacterium]